VLSFFFMVSRVVTPGEEVCCCGRLARPPSHGLPSFRHLCQEGKYGHWPTVPPGVAIDGHCGRNFTFCRLVLNAIRVKDAARAAQ
jgi:hypothetical protein